MPGEVEHYRFIYVLFAITFPGWPMDPCGVPWCTGVPVTQVALSSGVPLDVAWWASRPSRLLRMYV